MSATGADASAATVAPQTSEATSIAGLDLDDELQQLLKEQEDFLKQSKRPAAKVSRMGGSSRTPATTTAAAPAVAADDDEDAANAPQILGSVVERDVIDLNIRNVNVMPRAQANGFPVVQRRGESLFGKRQRKPGTATAGTTVKPSRFSALAKAQQSQQTVSERTATSTLDPERAEIDRTNRARLQEMSLREIRDAQSELLASLDPALVAKLMGRNTNKNPAPTTTNATATSVAVGKAIVTASPPSQSAATALLDLAKIQSEDELHAQAQLLPPDERAKHAWMSAVPASPESESKTSESESKPQRPRIAQRDPTLERFGFDGLRIDATAHVPTHSGLFHHGDAPDAAGYTLPELVHLARSSVASQRAVALTTIAKVLQHRQRRVACNDFAHAYPLVLPRELLLALRMALDDQNFTALDAAVTALHAFVVPMKPDDSSKPADGVTIDSSVQSAVNATASVSTTDNDDDAFEGVFGAVVPPPRVHVHPNIVTRRSNSASPSQTLTLEPAVDADVVYIDMDATTSFDDGSSSAAISDDALAQLDPVQALLHMDIATRIRFLLASVALPDAHAKLLDVLVTIAQHSPRAAKAIGTNVRLIQTLDEQLIANDAVLLRHANNSAALELAIRTLKLVRVLTQGSRAVASVLIASGVVQRTKGFLAIASDSDADDNTTAALYDALRLESLRIWRVLLLYGLDFHCFAYLFPLLCGFQGAVLVQPRSTISSLAQTPTKTPNKMHDPRQQRRPAQLQAALFAALEAFCGLAAVPDAQHYFTQLGVFLLQARDVVCTRNNIVIVTPDDLLLLAAALRFLAAAAPLVNKFHLDPQAHRDVLQMLTAPLSSTVLQSLTLHAPSSRAVDAAGCEVFAAALSVVEQVAAHSLLPDDDDANDNVAVAQRWLLHVQPVVLATLERGLAYQQLQDAAQSTTVPVLSLVLALAGDLVTRATSRNSDEDAICDSRNAFVVALVANALAILERLARGHEPMLHSLLQRVLFAPAVLQQTALFASASDAQTMARVLVPIYDALLLNGDQQQGDNAFGIGTDTKVPTAKRTCHLREPLTESDSNNDSNSNLPLPNYWLFSPFSRMEVAVSSSRDNAPTIGTRTENSEMALVVSATCRFLYALETATNDNSSASFETAAAWRCVSAAYARGLSDADKLVHVLYVLFAGADVLFDTHVEAALGDVLGTFATRVLTASASAPSLYDALVCNLRAAGDDSKNDDEDSSVSAIVAPATNAFATDEQLVLTFAEKLVGEFTAASFAHAHFARSVTLLLTSDFPIAIRRWIWHELAACRLLHTLDPFVTPRNNCDDQLAVIQTATFVKCAHAAADEQLLQTMARTLVRGDIAPARGAFAYSVAVHHVCVYLFGSQTGSQTMSFARQQLAQALVGHAAPSTSTVSLWRHLLSYDPHSDPRDGVQLLRAVANAQTTALDPQRVARMTQQAGLSPEQLVTFQQMCDQ